MRKPVVLHFFFKLPEKYNTRFWHFVVQRLPEFDHRSFAWANQLNRTKKGNGPFYIFRKLNTLRVLYSAFRVAKKADVIVFHGLFYGRYELFSFLLWPIRMYRRIVWSIWGGDLYYYKNRPVGWQFRLNEYLRRIFLARLRHATSFIPGDAKLLREVYNFVGESYRAFYPNPLGYQKSVSSCHSLMGMKKPFVLVGNSADPVNRHELLLKALYRVYDGSFGVYIPLAYGNPIYAEKVSKLAFELFGDDAVIQREFKTPDLYRTVLEQVAVGVFYHNRQQALGNILSLLSMNKKVYIRSDITTFKFLSDEGITIFDSFDLLKPGFMLLDLFRYEPNSKQAEKVLALVSDERAEKEWRELLFGIVNQNMK